MRKSLELSFRPYPLSGMARYSPGCLPSTIEEKPWTGCDGRGKVIPLAEVIPAPLGGPGASVSTGSTARPTSSTLEPSPGPAEASTAAPVTTASPTATLATVVIDLWMFMGCPLPCCQWLRRPSCRPRPAGVSLDGPTGRAQEIAVPMRSGGAPAQPGPEGLSPGRGAGHAVGMRARVVAAGAVTGSAVSLAVVIWVITRPDFARPDGGVGGPTPGWLGIIAPIAWTATGVTLLWLRPGNRVGVLILFVAVCQALAQGAAAYGTYGVGAADRHWAGAPWVAELATPLWIPGLLPMVTLLLAIYPDGRLPGRSWRLPAIVTVVGIAMLAVSMLGGYHHVVVGTNQPLRIHAPTPLLVLYVALMTAALCGGTIALWVMSIVRQSRSRPPERQQLTWLLCAIVASFALFLAPAWPGGSATSAIIPIAIAVGVLRYHLLGIEVVLRRGLVYATLTATVIAVYLLMTAVAGSRLTRGVPGVVAAALVAVGFTPVRERLQRGVDRLVYGDRRDPMRAVTRFGDSVAAAGEPEDLLPTVLMNVVNAVHARGAAVLSPDGRVVAGQGCSGDGVTLPLRVSGRNVGTLRVATRQPGEPYTDGDLRLLAALVPQVAVVVRALELAEALEAERDRVVTATRTERDRLRRDLHDGLGPSVSGVGLGLQALESAIDAGDESVAAELLERVRLEAGTAVA